MATPGSRLRLIPLAALCASVLPAWATNGMNMEGYGPVSTGLGGASQAIDHGTAAMAQNPRRENINLMPRIAAQLERKSPMTILRTRPVVAMLIALLILLTLSGVAYAIGRSLGYIPGIGIVDQNTPIRVLAEPVSQTRDGITITVSAVVLT